MLDMIVEDQAYVVWDIHRRAAAARPCRKEVTKRPLPDIVRKEVTKSPLPQDCFQFRRPVDHGLRIPRFENALEQPLRVRDVPVQIQRAAQ